MTEPQEEAPTTEPVFNHPDARATDDPPTPVDYPESDDPGPRSDMS